MKTFPQNDSWSFVSGDSGPTIHIQNWTVKGCRVLCGHLVNALSLQGPVNKQLDRTDTCKACFDAYDAMINPPPTDPYEPVPVFGKKEGKEVQYGLACIKCNNVFQSGTYGSFEKAAEVARNHCKPCPCGRKGRFLQGGSECSQCRVDAQMKDIREKNESLFPTLPRVEAYAWDGPVYDDRRDRYFESLDDLIEHYADDPEDAPEWVHPCDVEEFHLDADSILESACDDHCEEMAEAVGDRSESLQKLLDDWCKAVTTKTWRPDTGRVIELDPSMFEEEKADE